MAKKQSDGQGLAPTNSLFSFSFVSISALLDMAKNSKSLKEKMPQLQYLLVFSFVSFKCLSLLYVFSLQIIYSHGPISKDTEYTRVFNESLLTMSTSHNAKFLTWRQPMLADSVFFSRMFLFSLPRSMKSYKYQSRLKGINKGQENTQESATI